MNADLAMTLAAVWFFFFAVSFVVLENIVPGGSR
jgi:hypothetical protein